MSEPVVTREMLDAKTRHYVTWRHAHTLHKARYAVHGCRIVEVLRYEMVSGPARIFVVDVGYEHLPPLAYDPLDFRVASALEVLAAQAPT